MPLDPDAAQHLVTVRDCLRYGISRFREAGLVHGHGATSALDEAAYLILETLHLPLDQLDPFLDARLTPAERAEIVDILHRRVSTRLPAAYLTGRAYLGGMAFAVDPRVIVPRSFLAELLLGGLVGDGPDALITEPDTIGTVLDLCTGSACLALVAATVFPQARIDAVELSPDAAVVARQNIAATDGGERVTLYEGDLFEPVRDQRYDLIICNPPYVSAAEMRLLPPEYRHEPEMALAGGEDGLDVVRRILEEAPAHLTPGGALLCEVGTGREALENAFPDLDLLWLDTAESEGEVFWWQPSPAQA